MNERRLTERFTFQAYLAQGGEMICREHGRTRLEVARQKWTDCKGEARVRVVHRCKICSRLGGKMYYEAKRAVGRAALTAGGLLLAAVLAAQEWKPLPESFLKPGGTATVPAPTVPGEYWIHLRYDYTVEGVPQPPKYVSQRFVVVAPRPRPTPRPTARPTPQPTPRPTVTPCVRGPYGAPIGFRCYDCAGRVVPGAMPLDGGTRCGPVPTRTPTPGPVIPTPIPPTAIPPTAIPPTEIPVTEIPPTEIPVTEIPPTEIPAVPTPRPPRKKSGGCGGGGGGTVATLIAVGAGITLTARKIAKP